MNPNYNKWVRVSSSWVVAIYYDDSTQELSVEYKSGAVCVYSSNDSEADDFFAASSKGKWVWSNLYHRAYR